MNKVLLTNEEVAKAIRVDPDYPRDELRAYAEAATSFVHQKTGYKFADQNTSSNENGIITMPLYMSMFL